MEKQIQYQLATLNLPNGETEFYEQVLQMINQERKVIRLAAIIESLIGTGAPQEAGEEEGGE